MRRLRTLLTVLCVIGLGVPLAAQTSINFVTPRLSTATLTSAISLITDTCTATSCVQLNEAGYTAVSVQTVGTCGTCTLNFEGSNDGAIWVAVNLMPVAGTTAVSSTSTAGIWQGGVSTQQFRVRQSARSSGGFVVTARATLGTASAAGSSGGSPGGASGTIQYNNSGAFGGITFTDDNVLVGSGVAWQLKPLTDCAGATQAVTYATAGNTFGCNTISGTTPAGSGSELQARATGTTLQAVTGSSFASNMLALGANNLLTVRQVAETPDAVVSIYDNGSGKTYLQTIIADNDATTSLFGWWNRAFTATGDRALYAYQADGGAFYFQGDFPWLHLGVQNANNDQSVVYAIEPAAVFDFASGDAGVQLNTHSGAGDVSLEVTMLLSNPSASVITPVNPQASTVTYKLVCYTPLGYHTAAGAASTTDTSNATLNGSNYNIIAPPGLAGVVSCDIYRTAGGPSQGKLTGSPFAVGAFPVHDTGLAGDASTPTTVNTTGHVYVGAPLDMGAFFKFSQSYDPSTNGIFIENHAVGRAFEGQNFGQLFAGDWSIDPTFANVEFTINTYSHDRTNYAEIATAAPGNAYDSVTPNSDTTGEIYAEYGVDGYSWFVVGAHGLTLFTAGVSLDPLVDLAGNIFGTVLTSTAGFSANGTPGVTSAGCGGYTFGLCTTSVSYSTAPLIGTTSNIGGTLLAAAGSCATGTATVAGATTGMPVAASTSDGSAVSGLVSVYASVTSSNTVTVQVCAIAAVTPAAKTWNVAAIPR